MSVDPKNQIGAFGNPTNNLDLPMLVDVTNKLVDVFADCANQIDVSRNPTNNLDVFVLMADNSKVVDIANQVDVPVDCANQIGAFGNSAKQLGVPEDWASQLGEAEDWASQFDEVLGWASQSDSVNWACEVGVPVTGIDHISSTTMNGASTYGTNYQVLQKDGNVA